MNQENYHLQTNTRLALEEQINTYEKKKGQSNVGIFKYFRFTNFCDYILICVGSIFCVACGALVPYFSQLWGDMLDSFSQQNNLVSTTLNNLRFYMIIGASLFFGTWVMNTCWLMTAKRQSFECRRRYFASILNQEMGWFDCSEDKQLKSQLIKETMIFEQGISNTFTTIIYVISLGVADLIFSFVKGWLLSLVILGLLPILIFSIYMVLNMTEKKQKIQEQAYKNAATVADQALSGIKTVKILNGQKYEHDRYNKFLSQVSKGKIKNSLIFGLSFGGINASLLMIFALGFWFGANCIYETQHCLPSIAKQKYTAGTIMAILFSIIIIALNLSRLPIALRKLSEGRAAASRIFKLIDRKPRIKNPINGIIIKNFKGQIQFNNVTFSYPKQPQKIILNKLNMKISKHHNAFVGDSGCGKSTILQLLMRFYDPNEGVIKIDGYDLKSIDLNWWRNTIGYVGQEPVLFSGTIKQNLLFSKSNASDQELKQVLIKAEVWNFIDQLENKMDTHIGQGGSLISGGQKQRIAIARALIRNPKILLFDEATSALDIKNQRKIQTMLNKLSKEIVSIAIAHRLNTIKSANEIFVIEKGSVIEKGAFQQLKRFQYLAQQSKYQKIEAHQPINDQYDLNSGQKIQNDKEQQVCKKESKEQQIQKKFSFLRVFSYLKGNYIIFGIGILVTAIFGSIFPAFSVILSSVMVMLLENESYVQQVNIKTLIIFLLSLLALVVGSIQTIIFQKIGEKISLKIRSEVFYKLMKLPIVWFEKQENTVGQISSKLGIGCFHMKQLATVYVYALFQNLFTLISAVIISLVFEWRTALVFIGLIPLSIGSTALRAYFDHSFTSQNVNKSEKSIFNPNQVLSNIRTVKALGYDIVFKNIYIKSLQKEEKKIYKISIVSGLFFGMTEILTYFISSFIFYIGSVFYVENNFQLFNIMTAILALNFASQSIGNNSHIIPNATKCKLSISHLFSILDTDDEDSNQIRQKSLLIKDKNIEKRIVFKDVNFRYKNRGHLLNNFNIQIPFGQKVGFVGYSGCGKSTIFSLLLRFYEPQSGEILLDDINIKDYDIHYLRSQFGVVLQEPFLFDTTIKQNLIYNIESVDQNKIISCLENAQALNFCLQNQSQSQKMKIINSQRPKNQLESLLKNGIERSVGPKGSHISGGQKKRLAIARTILRDPKILLLDEATSNLDSFNEQKVQKNLDMIRTIKLFIVIAHRLQTIKNSDTIFIFQNGSIVESGNYEYLMGKKNQFFKLSKGC